MDLISVIVPVYNVEKYLGRCIDSILEQTYDNLEIILIDDGSTDNSGLICDKYAYKFENIKSYHKKNGGISSARNYGLDKISNNSKYVAFVDSDDFLSPQMYKILYDNLIKYKCEIAICNFQKIYNESPKEYISDRVQVLNNEEYMNQYFDDSYKSNVVWNKLYTRKCLEGIRFEKGKIYEDIFYSPQVACRARRIVINESNLYYYYQRQGSILNGAVNSNAWNDFFDSYEFVVKLGINIKNKIFTSRAIEIYLGALLKKSINLYYIDRCQYMKFKKRYNRAIRKYVFRLNRWENIFIYMLFYININLYLLFNKKKRFCN